MAARQGFEPRTSSLTGSRSNRWSYRATLYHSLYYNIVFELEIVKN